MALIKVVTPVYRTREKEVNGELLQTTEYLRDQIIQRELEELRDFEEHPAVKKGVYKKRCIVYTEQGPIIVAHSFNELKEIKRNQYTSNKIGFKYGKERRTSRR